MGLGGTWWWDFLVGLVVGLLSGTWWDLVVGLMVGLETSARIRWELEHAHKEEAHSQRQDDGCAPWVTRGRYKAATINSWSACSLLARLLLARNREHFLSSVRRIFFRPPVPSSYRSYVSMGRVSFWPPFTSGNKFWGQKRELAASCHSIGPAPPEFGSLESLPVSVSARTFHWLSNQPIHSSSSKRKYFCPSFLFPFHSI